MKVNVKKVDFNWLDIKNLCRTTIALKDSQKEPTEKWIRDLLISQHSPIRDGEVLFEIEDIPYCISTHLARHHEGCEKFIQTSRSDRTGVDRSERKQTDPVNMKMKCNIEALINISAKRLCLQADKDTIKAWKMVLEAIKEYDKNVYWACVPQCIRHGGCTEMFGDCKFFENFAKDLTKEQLIDLRQRYDAYNEFRERKVIKK
jgi:hypothetical protein